MICKRDIIALGLTAGVVALVAMGSRGGAQGGGAPPHLGESAVPFSIEPEPCPDEKPVEAARPPAPESPKETQQMVKQQSADAARGEAGPSATSQPALVLAAAKQAPMKADEAKVAAVARPPARNEPAQPGKADVPSPKPARAWVVELKANVQVTVDIESLNGDDICDKMADQVVLILDNSLSMSAAGGPGKAFATRLDKAKTEAKALLSGSEKPALAALRAYICGT